MFMIVGATIEYPELLDDSELAACGDLLTGDAAKVVALARTFASEAGKTLYATEFLARLEGQVREFAAKHLAAPKYETLADAKAEALVAVDRLRRLQVEQETTEVSSEQRRNLGWDESARLASEVAKKQRERHGLK